jgi:ribosomal protein S18 acetylase RimI-like enzyme
MIKLLEHRQSDVAHRIFCVFQQAYRVEAELIGVDEFPPLNRDVGEIQAAQSQFFGLFLETELAAIVECFQAREILNIDSLVVLPAYFRRGLASRLLQHLLDSRTWRSAFVETADTNGPAIAFYEKLGFAIVKGEEIKDGIQKVKLRNDAK